jgi:hypothetical protein
MEVPLVTIDSPYHGPEIEYLINEKNGIKLDADATPESYAKCVVSLMENEGFRAHLQLGCRLAAEKYTLEAMVERFAEGVLRALNSGTRPSHGR